MLTGNSLIRSTFGNMEALIYHADERRVVHYWRNGNVAGAGWNPAQTVSERAIGPACLCQSDFGTPGNFEALVPEAEGVVHYWRDNGDLKSPWQRAAVVAPGATGPGALLQNRSDHSREAVILSGARLTHYRCDIVSRQWREVARVTDQAAGPATLLTDGDENARELLVPVGRDLVQYIRDGDKWQQVGVVSRQVSGGAAGTGQRGRYDVLVPEGAILRHYRRDSDDPTKPWRPVGNVARSVGQLGAVTLVLGAGGVLEALVQESGRSLFAYQFRSPGSVLDRAPVWMRSACLWIDEGAIVADRSRPQSEKVCQVTGQRDRQRGGPAFNRTEERFGIRGTDLGAAFEHGGRTYFLFGDTHRTGPVPAVDLDAIAVSTDTDISHGLNLTFHKSYPRIVGPAVGQKAFEVPADGFSHGGAMFVFFTTDGFTNGKIMGRSVLTRCRETAPDFARSRPDAPLDFVNLGTLSERWFINVSVECIEAASVRQYGLPGTGPGLLLWGTGTYRADALRLAYLPLTDQLLKASGPIPQARLGLRYWAGPGMAGKPRWSNREEDALPLFAPATLGEMSVRWNPLLKRWLLFYCTGPGDSAGLAVCLRTAQNPWGPWSRRRLVFDWQHDGLGKFMHLHGRRDGQDESGKDIGAGAYAPYQLPRHTARTGPDEYALYYLLSTWNPYQVMLMRHRLRLDDLRALERGDS